jgi:hypothetical protein
MSHIKRYIGITAQLKLEYKELLEMLRVKYLSDVDALVFQQDRVEERLLCNIDNIDIDFVLSTMKKTSSILNKKLKDIETEYTRAIQVANEFYKSTLKSIDTDERIYIREQLF